MSSSDARPPRDVTRNDVARLAGVSSAVVSYVVNNGPRPVAEATRARVQAAIDKLGYRPNAAARSLITGRSDLLGLIVPDLRNPYFAALAQAVEVAARAKSMNLVLAQGTTGSIAPLVETLSGHLVAGVVTATIPEPEAVAVALRSRVPLVRMSLAMPTERLAIWPDYYGGARSAVRHLVDVHGHREVALVIGTDHPEAADEPMDDRERGWRDELAEAGLGTGHRVRVHWSSAGGLAAAELLASAHPGVTAVFAASDQIAIGLVAGLHRAGRPVPDAVAVASFDGSPEAEFAVSPLTTAGVPLARMARAAVAEVLGTVPKSRSYPTSLVVRESCGCGTTASGNG
jgi:LacI family transcriptional regulator